MEREAMTNRENYSFDVAGYLHVPGALIPEAVDQLNGAIAEVGKNKGMLAWPGATREPFRDLLVHPTLV